MYSTAAVHNVVLFMCTVLATECPQRDKRCQQGLDEWALPQVVVALFKTVRTTDPISYRPPNARGLLLGISATVPTQATLICACLPTSVAGKVMRSVVFVRPSTPSFEPTDLVLDFVHAYRSQTLDRRSKQKMYMCCTSICFVNSISVVSRS